MAILGRLITSLGIMPPIAPLQKSVNRLVRDTRRTHESVNELRESLTAEVRKLQKEVQTLTLRESQLRSVMRADAAFETELAGLAAHLDEKRVAAHIAEAIDRSELKLHPFPHIIVQNVFPDGFYEALVRGIPPVELFGDKPFNKQQLKVPFGLAPEYSRRVWNFFVYRIASRSLQRALVDKFREPLVEWISRHWPRLAGNPFGPPMEFHTADGRIMLRGRGYRIRPHRDPKWGFLTCLLYLARDTDSESWGTQLFSVAEDRPARGAAPHWIDPAQCTHVADVPFRRNSMLVFLNSTGAHGAQIPDDAEPADLERYIYQCRVGPNSESIRKLMAELKEEEAVMWAGKGSY